MSARVVNVKLGEPFDLYIGRTMKQGYHGKHSIYVNQGWGNPFRGGYNAIGAGDAISRYSRWLLQPEQKTLLAHVGELAGKSLGCWCAPAGGLAGDIEGHICHGQILAALADDPERMIARLRQLIVRQDNLARAAARTAGRNSREHIDRDFRHLRPLALPTGWDTGHGDGGHGAFHRQGRRPPDGTPKSAPAGSGIKANVSFHAASADLVWSRNKRSVWTVATAPFPDAHFATFPPKLIEPCVLAGSRSGDLVLDPFAGSGTVGLVARQQGRDYLLVDLNADYCRMAEERIGRECPVVQERIRWQA